MMEVIRVLIGRLGKPSRKKSAVFFNIVQTGGRGVIPMFKNVDVKYVTFKGPFGSINYGIERMFKSRNVPNRG